MSATDTTNENETETAAPMIRKAPPLPAEVSISIIDGQPLVTSPEAPASDVPRDGDEITVDGETFVFVNYDTKGDAVTVAALAQSAYEKDKSRVNFARFNETYRSFQLKVVQYGIVESAGASLVAALAEETMNLRLAITLQNGDPDYWGRSWAYRLLFDDRIRGFLRDQGFSLDKTNKLLNNVRTDYLRRNETVLNAAALSEAARGTVAKQKGVASAKVETITAPNGQPTEAVVITYEKQDKEGNPVVETWTPGDSSMPKPLANVIKAAATRADGDKAGQIVKRLPEKVTGKPKPSATGNRANESGANERNYATEAANAIAAFVECIPHVQPLQLVALLHEAGTALSDYLIGAPNVKPSHDSLPGGPKVVGEALNAPGSLLLATGAAMAAGKSKGDVAPFRFTAANDEKTADNGGDNN